MARTFILTSSSVGRDSPCLLPLAPNVNSVEAEKIFGFRFQEIIQPNSVHGMPKNHARSAVWN